MAGFDEGRVWSSYQGLENENFDQDALDQKRTVELFLGILRDRDGVSQVKSYREQLLDNRTHVLVDIRDIRESNAKLADKLLESPVQTLPHLEEAATKLLRETLAQGGEEEAVIPVQVMLFSSVPLPNFPSSSIRDLESKRVSKLVMVTGIITAASKPRHKATHLTIQCKTCKGTKMVPVRPGLNGAHIPGKCDMGNNIPGIDQDCGQNPYQVMTDRSLYVDQQIMKLQERPEDVPTGELPRTVQMVADRHLCGQVTPGTRVSILGIYDTWKGKAMDKGAAVTLQQPYIRAVSIIQDAGDAHSSTKFTNEEIQEFEQFAKQDRVHEELFSRIAPNIFGSEDIKKAVACLLFGGARKALPDGTNRRGDINVLLLGDPSTAKSQFLKFASKVAPISVYTSGKGSSAAGLTATVVQDPASREFYLEGGAMVLADNGVVCIDEFDKMRPEDRVAIHEAMEQQTISIAKAGITTMLKSRTSVLAAANPPSGRYDDFKTAQENIDLQSTILSRFDLIFIVKDPATRERDMQIARHVLDNHRLGSARRDITQDQAHELEFLKRYIHYCRTQCSPRLTEQAEEKLASFYVEIRAAARAEAAKDNMDTPPVPITVRQLEAVIRISESFARMSLQKEATIAHVDMAIDLFKKSTMDAVKSGVSAYEIASDPQRNAIHRLEEKIKRRMHIGAAMTLRRLMDEMVALGEPEQLVMRACVLLTRTGDFEFRRERSVFMRKK